MCAQVKHCNPIILLFNYPMETARLFQKLVPFNITTRRHNTEDHALNLHRSENIKFR
jgi:hypothetical protein